MEFRISEIKDENVPENGSDENNSNRNRARTTVNQPAKSNARFPAQRPLTLPTARSRQHARPTTSPTSVLEAHLKVIFQFPVRIHPKTP